MSKTRTGEEGTDQRWVFKGKMSNMVYNLVNVHCFKKFREAAQMQSSINKPGNSQR